MATLWAHRVLIVVPAARRAAMITFWDSQIDSGHGADTWNVPLNASGNPGDAPTHYWVSMAMQANDLRLLVTRLCQVAGITAPANWQSMTRQQQLDWLASNLPTIRTATGIAVVRDDGDGTWSDPSALLTALGIQRLREANPLQGLGLARPRVGS